MKTFLLSLTLTLITVFAGIGFGNGEVYGSRYGAVVETLLERMHATVVQCDDLMDVPEVCFAVDAAGLGLLAASVGDVVEEFAPAGLQAGPWLAGNGVHSLRLTFETTGVDALDVFLAEDSPSHVRGMLRLGKR